MTTSSKSQPTPTASHLATGNAWRLLSTWLSSTYLLLSTYVSSLLWLLLRPARITGNATTRSIPSGPTQQKQADWTTLDFSATQPIAPAFDYTSIPARPYRPWHDGPHHVTMAIQRVNLDDWVEIDHEYLSRYQYKRILFRDHAPDTICNKPGSEEACFEALYYVADFLPQRYPTMFTKTAAGIKNLVTGDDWDLRRTSTTWDDYTPLQVVALLTTEDWFVLQTDDDGQTTRLTAGASCFPAGWRLRERIGMSLWDIHAPAVPSYKPKLAKSMDRFFLRLRADQPYMRFNYGIDLSAELFHIHNHHNLTKETLQKPVTLEQLHLRVERQTLQRLPRSRAIVFGIRTYVTPITEVTRDLDVARALRTQVASFSEDVSRYKNKALWWDVLERHLNEVIPDKGEEQKTK